MMPVVRMMARTHSSSPSLSKDSRTISMRYTQKVSPWDDGILESNRVIFAVVVSVDVVVGKYSKAHHILKVDSQSLQCGVYLMKQFPCGH